MNLKLTGNETEVLAIILTQYIGTSGKTQWRNLDDEVVRLVDLAERLFDAVPNRGDQ